MKSAFYSEGQTGNISFDLKNLSNKRGNYAYNQKG
jgi:hypothetical protein